jgi:uncharacterized protein YbbC (DUF1343 family)
MAKWIEKALAKAVARSGAPGAAAYVGEGNRTLFHGAAGLRRRMPDAAAADPDTVYDLASLTKVVATTTAALLLHAEGRLDLDAPAAEYLPMPGFERFTIRHLLTHTSGLPPYALWYPEVHALEDAIQRIIDVKKEPPGVRRRYSDPGFMLLGKIIEIAARDTLGAFCERRIFAPLGMQDTRFRPPREWQDRCAATEVSAWRGKLMLGEVHDEHAWAVGGVSGHAGLFSTAADLAKFCRAILDNALLSEALTAEMTRPQLGFYPWQGLGWQLDGWMDSVSGCLPSRAAFGHTGWTGTCLWADRDTKRFAVLLSNTCHPSREKRNNRALRRAFFTQAATHLYPDRLNTHTGLDRLVWDGFGLVAGKRIALLTNHAAVSQTGRPVLHVLAAGGAPPAVIFSPEHGLRGQAEAGEAVASEQGPVPIISLYGNRKAPAASELRGIDLFVIDLPDVGARYYTYIATMKECLGVCAKTRTPVLILDRPNPLGGVVLEGPVAEKTGSPVCCAPIPIRHGMTLGEAALFFLKTVFRGSRLQILIAPAGNWYRELQFRDCSLPWIPPSPNIPDPETALVYAGTCLFEGVNMNEGRGTETPFRRIGAPWLDAEAVLGRLPREACAGFRLETVTYTPQSLPGRAANPRYRDESCRGVFIHSEAPYAARPFTLAVALLQAIHEKHGDQLEWRNFFDTLAGGPRLRKQILRGISALEIAASFEAEHKRFEEIRPRRYETRAELQAAF